MPKVSVKYGLTLKVADYNMLRVDVAFDDIDVNGDVQAQIAQCASVYGATSPAAEQAVADAAANASGLSIEGVGFGTALAEYKAKMKAWMENIVGEIKRQKGIIDNAAAMGIIPTIDGRTADQPPEKPVKKAKS